MKVVAMQLKADALGKRIIMRDPRTGTKRMTRNGRSYVRVTLGIFLSDDEVETFAAMGTTLGERIEIAVEQALTTFKTEPKPTRKIVVKGEKA